MKRLMTFIVLASFLSLGFVACDQTPKVEAGQVWVYDFYSNKDPFKPTKTGIPYKIIAIKDGYVQYEDMRTGEIDSSTISWFLADADLKNETKE